MKKTFAVISLILSIVSCSTPTEIISEVPNVSPSMYFPPIGSDVWETKTMQSVGWNASKVQPLLDFLTLKNSKSFIVLVDGKIVMEHYFNGHSAAQPRYWASAGKTLTAATFGIAEQEGLVQRSNTVSATLGTGWTSAPLSKENLITNQHLLTMTSGLDDINGDCVTANCLTYTADAGNRWAYHNVYVKLQDVIARASGQSFISYFNGKLRDRIGMTGNWFISGNNVVFLSTARSAARFGLFILNSGKWENTQILNAAYIANATSTSQNLNQAYGYLWWLNGKTSYMLPSSQMQFSGTLIPSAPADMFMALGKNDQKIYVIPSKKMVVIRMGDSADGTNFALSTFDRELWSKISDIIN